MLYNVMQVIARGVLMLAILSLVAARPQQHFGPESNQVNGDGDGASNLLGAPSLTDLQMELLAQRLAEYNNQIPSAWDRIVKSPDLKRQSRFRQCYFNPVSCFKK